MTWLSTAAAAQYLGQPSANAFRLWARRHKVAMVKLGRLWRVRQDELDRALGLPKRRERTWSSSSR